jgi:large subunit ribosomal protein L3
MAGRMGGKNVTTQNLLVHRIDTLLNIIYVHGAVPGPPGGFVRVMDAKKKVSWKAGARARKGLNLPGEVLEGITGFPMPVGTIEMAKSLPREIEAGRKTSAVLSK